jgi:hypothetical protein
MIADGTGTGADMVAVAEFENGAALTAGHFQIVA